MSRKCIVTREMNNGYLDFCKIANGNHRLFLARFPTSVNESRTVSEDKGVMKQSISLSTYIILHSQLNTLLRLAKSCIKQNPQIPISPRAKHPTNEFRLQPNRNSHPYLHRLEAIPNFQLHRSHRQQNRR